MSKRNTRTKMESKTNYGKIALIGVAVLVAAVLFTVFTPSVAAENFARAR